MLLHTTSVAINHHAVLIAGPAGIGKSDLALRLIDAGAELIADDQTLLNVEGDQLIASSPTAIKGLIEVRHIGLLRLPSRDKVPVALYVELVSLGAELERLPEPATIKLDGIHIPHLKLPTFAASTPVKIRAALLYHQAEED